MAASPISTSLFDRYAGGSPSSSPTRRRRIGHMTTKTAHLRANGTKLACYLNTECNCGRTTIIHLPEECDTMGEVLPKIQARMQLDSRMLYASELFLPNGDKITILSHAESPMPRAATCAKHLSLPARCGSAAELLELLRSCYEEQEHSAA